jgi:hypothetical protein
MTIRVQQIDLDAIEAYAAGRDMAADMSWCEVAFIELGGRAILDDDIAHDKIAIAVQRSQIRQVSLVRAVPPGSRRCSRRCSRGSEKP